MPEKLCFGYIKDDMIVHPHPPVQRALKETLDKLSALHVLLFYLPSTHLLTPAPSLQEPRATRSSNGSPLSMQRDWTSSVRGGVCVVAEKS